MSDWCDPIWPEAPELLLLTAAMSQGSRASKAAAEWAHYWRSAGGGLRSRRMLPLLRRNLKALGLEVDQELATLLKQQTLQTWGTNKLLFHQLSDLLSIFKDAGIPTLLLKGSALTPFHYDNDLALRPMNDIDVLVPPASATRAIEVLQRNGWIPEQRGLEAFSPEYMRVSHGHPFRKPGSYQCDLHWHAFPVFARDDDDADLWQASRQVELSGIPTRILNDADQALHLCLHGARWNHERSIHWLADLLTVIRSANFDWHRCLQLTLDRRQVMPVRESLGYLKTHLDAEIPDLVMNRLNEASISTSDRWEYGYQLGDHHERALRYLPILWWHYRRWAEADGPLKRPLGFARYLRRYWGAESNAEFFRLLLNAFRRNA